MKNVRIFYITCLCTFLASSVFAQKLDSLLSSDDLNTYDSIIKTDKEERVNTPQPYANLTLSNRKTLPSILKEISGMVYWNEKLYCHQDSGGEPSIFVVDPNSAAIVQTIKLQGIVNKDWEDITQDATHFYICDVGNNSGNRTDLKIYKFEKSLITTEETVTIPNSEIEVIKYTYEGQNGTSREYDCEAVAYNRGKLHLFTKNWVGTTCKHYSLPTEAGTYVAKLRETFDVGDLKITGADFGAYDMLVLVGYEVTGTAMTALYLDYGFDGTYYYFKTGQHKRLNTGGAPFGAGQIEGVAMKDVFRGIVSNEYFKKLFFEVKQSIASFNIKSHIENHYKTHPLDLYKFATPKEGTIRYNKNTDKLEGFDGTHWLPFH